MKKFITALILAMVVFAAQAQALKVSTGGSSGNYSRVFKELSSICMNQIQMTEMNSSGSTQNIDRLAGNEVNAAFVQTDVLFYRGRTEDLGNVKTLVALFPEEVHVVSLTQSNIKEGGTLGFGAKSVQLNTVNDLVGRTVVAAGGSYITAQVIRLQTEIAFNVVEAPSAEAALKAVADGTAHAAILVGGTPLGQIANLDKSFKLLSFPEATSAKLKNVYMPSKLNYSKMGAAGVPTVATSTIFVTREYKTAKFIDSLAKLRACINSSLPELQETTGFSPVWQKVDPSNKGKWAYYDLPVAKK
jgi:TRAP-type uncharacterized transport system substrate-binding protein